MVLIIPLDEHNFSRRLLSNKGHSRLAALPPIAASIVAIISEVVSLLVHCIARIEDNAFLVWLELQ